MATTRRQKHNPCSTTCLFLLLPLLIQFYSGRSDLQLNYYEQSCPNAEEIIKQEVINLYNKHGNTAVSWVRNLFHDCGVKSCDASLLLETANGIESEQESDRSFGMRNFKYVRIIKEALEKECPMTFKINGCSLSTIVTVWLAMTKKRLSIMVELTIRRR
ncbi:hypothetical protein SLA2020_370400 [Shorea laevis]